MVLLTQYEVKDQEGQQILDNIAIALGYQETINGQPNPQTKQQHYQAWVLEKTLELSSEQIRATAKRAAAESKNVEIEKIKTELIKKGK